MAYAPQNLQMFTAVFAGAIAGMGASDRIPISEQQSTYAESCSIAGAWAESFDTEWAATPANLYTVEAAQVISESVWNARAPNLSNASLAPSHYTHQVRAIIAMILAGSSFFASQGITPPPIPSGSGGGTAFIFDGGLTSENGRTNRATEQSPIDNTKIGIINMASQDGETSATGATADFVTISGGDNQSAGGEHDTIGGGSGHTTGTVGFNVICGGQVNNTASCFGSFIGGGTENSCQNGSSTSTIGGGQGNTCDSGQNQTIGGGQGNLAQGDSCTIAGGDTNTASGLSASVGGGANNQATADRATIAGGQNNVASAVGATVIGGLNGNATRRLQQAFGGESTDAQSCAWPIGGTSVNNAAAVLQSADAHNLTLENKAYAINYNAIAVRSDVPGACAMFKGSLLAHNIGAGAVIDANVTDSNSVALKNGQTWTLVFTAAGADIVATFHGAAGQTVNCELQYTWNEIINGS